MDLMSFYSKNLENLDAKWKKFCFENFKGKEVGDKYYSQNAFWRFVEKEYQNDERLRERTA